MALMYYYQNFSVGAYLQLALHGSYGIFWVMKDVMFPDNTTKENKPYFQH